MRVGFSAFWLQKAGNSVEEYEDAFAPADAPDADCAEYRCAIADGATETSFSGLWAQILVDAFVGDRLPQIKPETLDSLSAQWRTAIASRHKPLPWYALEKLERGAFSSLLGLTIRADGGWRAVCVGDSCLFHVRPHQPIRAFPYHLPEQFNNHPALVSTRTDSSVGARVARGKWKAGDYFLLMTDALAHFFLSQRSIRARLAADELDQPSFAQLVESARAARICRNDDVTLLKVVPALREGQGGLWPNPNEYVEAIQYPQQAFADADLRSAKVVTNRFGLPRPISGNFATVFEVETNDCTWAVRCFLREITNQKERYAAITAHLKRHALPFMVNFDYLPEGIRVRGKWYPVLKMDWTPGIRLDTYIEQHLNNPQMLRQLGERWLALCRSLRQAEIAHGDLQHGNILVTGADEIKLIDYDGMIVPEVLGLANNEIGHRHYQHPSRTTDRGITASNFQNVDNFSCYVIGLSLLALSVDPSLWKKTQAGEENLLFRDVDFGSPGKSAVFDRLRSHDDARVRAAAQMMQEAVQAPSYLEVPPFERNPLDTRLTNVRSWLLSRVAAGIPSLVAEPALQATDETKSSWIYDHLEQAQFDFADEFIAHERASVEAEFQRSIFHALNALFPLFALVQFVWRYSSYPQSSEKAAIAGVYRSLQQQLLEAKTRRKTLSRLIVECDRRYQQAIRIVEANIADLSHELELSRQQEAREAMRLERALHSTTHELLGQRLEPGRIAGIEAAQIDALAQAGIRTAADLTPANEAAALHALNSVDLASPRSSWENLMQWRREHVSPITADDVQNVHRRYAQNQHSLERQQREAERQLQEIQATSADLQMSTRLHEELSEREAEIDTLQRQYFQTSHELSRYELITLKRFLWKMVTLPSQ